VRKKTMNPNEDSGLQGKTTPFERSGFNRALGAVLAFGLIACALWYSADALSALLHFPERRGMFFGAFLPPVAGFVVLLWVFWPLIRTRWGQRFAELMKINSILRFIFVSSVYAVGWILMSSVFAAFDLASGRPVRG